MKKSDNIIFRGYTKKENNNYVAVCIDLNIVAQANSLSEAINECDELVREYIRYICEEYPDKFDEFIPRYAPQELIDEYNSIISKSLKPQHKESKRKPTHKIRNFDFPQENYCTASV